MSDYISIHEAIEKINERARETFTLAPGYEYYLGALHDVADDLRQMPTIENRLVKEIAGKSPEETYDFINWLMHIYGMQFTDSRGAVIEWLKGEDDEHSD